MRRAALQNMDEEQFRSAQEGMNASDKEYWSEQARLNPLNTYANLRNYFASEETPDERRKRERREHLGQVFANLGNLIGNAAQLYYTAKGAVPADLNAGAFAENERMRRIKEKRDALKARQDAILAMKLKADKDKADADRKLKEQQAKETGRHNRAMEANAARAQDKIVDSVIGADGNIYTRNTRLTENEARQIVNSTGLNGEDLRPFITRKVTQGDYGQQTVNEEVDWMAAAAYALENGMVYPEELRSRGFKLGGGMYPPEKKSAPYMRNNNNSKKAPYARQ